MGTDAEFDIVANDRTGAATRSAASNFDRLGRTADSTGRKLDDMGDEAAQAGRRFDGLTHDTSQLAVRLLETKAAMARLSNEFNSGGGVNLIKDFGKQQAEFGRLSKLAKNVNVDAGGGGKTDLFSSLFKDAKTAGASGGKLAAEGFASTFNQVGSAIPGALKAYIGSAIVGAAVVATPLMISAINGALLAGIGGGALVGAILLGARDPRVISGYNELGHRIMSGLDRDIMPFATELAKTPALFGEAWTRQEPRVHSIFVRLSESVVPLTRGLIGGIEAAFPGLEKGIKASADLLVTLGAQLTPLGRSIGNLFSTLAYGADGGKAALVFLVLQVRIFIEAIRLAVAAVAPFGNAVYAAASAADRLRRAVSGEEVADHAVALDIVKGSAYGAATAEGALRAALSSTAGSADMLNAAFDRLFGEMMSVDQANLAIKVGFTNLRQSVQDNGTSLDENTAKGQANIQSVLSQIQALDQKRQADIAAGNGTRAAADKANAAYASNVGSLRAVLTQLGFSAAAIDRLIGKYASIPREITTTIVQQYRVDGRPLMGNSHYGAIDKAAGPGYAGGSWRPADFAASTRLRAAAQAGTQLVGGPSPVSSNHFDVTVRIGDETIRSTAKVEARKSTDRAAWRANTGRR